MGDLLLTGGKQRYSRFLAEPEWRSTQRAVLLRLDANTGELLEKFDYITPPDACADDTPGIQFKAASLYENKLYACTSTEVIVYALPRFRPVGYVSLPIFNDLHHVLPTPSGTLIVVVTGLDLVVEITPEGKILREWSALGENTWARFSREVDYRKVPTTKPHRCHPNFAFMLDGEIWTTRCQLKDAICLSNPGQRINVEVASPHDGLMFNGRLYFTTVDGHLVVANPSSFQVERVFDLNTIDNPEGRVLGWCRGLLPLSESLIWVGFTQLRPTKFKENLSWLKGPAGTSRPTRIALYDLSANRCLREVPLGSYGMDVVFSILGAPEALDTRLSVTCTDAVYSPGQTSDRFNVDRIP